MRMSLMLRRAIRPRRLLAAGRVLSASARCKSSYEGDGKTTVQVLNQDQELGLMIDSFATFGFRLNIGITVIGPMAIFPRTVMSWQVRGSDEISEATFRLFALLEPKVDLLVVGVETADRHVLDDVRRAARAMRLNAEVLPTEHACSTFNFLNAEGRSVAGALIPPMSMVVDENDMLESQMVYRDVFNWEQKKP